MRKSIMLSALLASFSMLAMAESFQGRLVDLSCYNQQKSATACDPSATSNMFALVVADKAYPLDENGNTKAATAIKNRADRANDPSKPLSSQVNAKITGTKTGDSLKVDAIEVQ